MFQEHAAELLRSHAKASYTRQAIRINDRIVIYVGYGHRNSIVIAGIRITEEVPARFGIRQKKSLRLLQDVRF